MTKLMNVEEAKVEASKMNYKVFLQVYDVLNCDFNRIEENDSKPEELRNMERAALILNSTKLDDSQNRALETLIDIIGEQFPRTAEEVEFNGKTFPRGQADERKADRFASRSLSGSLRTTWKRRAERNALVAAEEP